MNTPSHSRAAEDLQKLRQEVEELKSDIMLDVAAIRHDLAVLRQEALANRFAIASVNLELAKLQVEFSGFSTSTQQIPHLREPPTIKKRAGSKDLFNTEGNSEGSAFSSKRVRYNEPIDETAKHDFSATIHENTPMKGQDNDSPLSSPKDRFRQATYGSPRPPPKSIKMTEPMSFPKMTPETISISPMSVPTPSETRATIAEAVLPTSVPELLDSRANTTAPIPPVSILTPSDSGAMAAIPAANSSKLNPITSNLDLQISRSVSLNSINMFKSTLEFAENANSVETSDPKTNVTDPEEAARAANEHATDIHYPRPLLEVRIGPNEEKPGSQIRVDQGKTSTSTGPGGSLRGTMFQDSSDEESDVFVPHRVQNSTNATADMRSDSDSNSDSNDETVTQRRPPRILLKAPAFSAQMSPMPGLRKLLDPVRERHADFLPDQYLGFERLPGIFGGENLPEPEYFTPAELLLLLGISSKEVLPGVWSTGMRETSSWHLLESRCQPLLNAIAGRHGLQLTALPEKLLKRTGRRAQPFFLKLSSRKIMYLGHYTLYGVADPLTEREMKHFVKDVIMKYWAKVLNSRSKYLGYSESITNFLYEELYHRPKPDKSQPILEYTEHVKKQMKGFKSGDFINAFKASRDTPHLQLYWQRLEAISFDHVFYKRLVKKVGVYRKKAAAEAVDPSLKEVKIPDLSRGKKIQEATSDEECDPIITREFHAGLSIDVPPPTELGSNTQRLPSNEERPRRQR